MDSAQPLSPKVHVVSPYSLNPLPSPSIVIDGETPRTTARKQRGKSANIRAKALKLMREKAALIQKPTEVATPYTRKLASPYTIVTTIKTEEFPLEGDKVKMGWMVSHQLLNLLGTTGNTKPGRAVGPGDDLPSPSSPRKQSCISHPSRPSTATAQPTSGRSSPTKSRPATAKGPMTSPTRERKHSGIEHQGSPHPQGNPLSGALSPSREVTKSTSKELSRPLTGKGNPHKIPAPSVRHQSKSAGGTSKQSKIPSYVPPEAQSPQRASTAREKLPPMSTPRENGDTQHNRAETTKPSPKPTAKPSQDFLNPCARLSEEAKAAVQPVSVPESTEKKDIECSKDIGSPRKDRRQSNLPPQSKMNSTSKFTSASSSSIKQRRQLINSKPPSGTKRRTVSASTEPPKTAPGIANNTPRHIIHPKSAGPKQVLSNPYVKSNKSASASPAVARERQRHTMVPEKEPRIHPKSASAKQGLSNPYVTNSKPKSAAPSVSRDRQKQTLEPQILNAPVKQRNASTGSSDSNKPPPYPSDVQNKQRKSLTTEQPRQNRAKSVPFDTSTPRRGKLSLPHVTPGHFETPATQNGFLHNAPEAGEKIQVSPLSPIGSGIEINSQMDTVKMKESPAAQITQEKELHQHQSTGNISNESPLNGGVADTPVMPPLDPENGEIVPHQVTYSHQKDLAHSSDGSLRSKQNDSGYDTNRKHDKQPSPVVKIDHQENQARNEMAQCEGNFQNGLPKLVSSDSSNSNSSESKHGQNHGEYPIAPNILVADPLQGNKSSSNQPDKIKHAQVDVHIISGSSPSERQPSKPVQKMQIEKPQKTFMTELASPIRERKQPTTVQPPKSSIPRTKNLPFASPLPKTRRFSSAKPQSSATLKTRSVKPTPKPRQRAIVPVAQGNRLKSAPVLSSKQREIPVPSTKQREATVPSSKQRDKRQVFVEKTDVPSKISEEQKPSEDQIPKDGRRSRGAYTSASGALRNRFSPYPKETKLAIVGGTTSTDEVSYICWIQDSSNEGWEELTQLPEMIDEMAVCQTNTGLLLIGGHIRGEASSQVYHYISETMKWNTMTPMPNARHCSAAVLVEDTQEVFVLGGGVGIGDSMKISPACSSLDTLTNRWAQHPLMKKGMLWPIAVAIKSCIFVLYNDQEEDEFHGTFRTLQMYDMSKFQWSFRAPLPENVGATCGAQAVAIDQTMLVAGGHDRICAQYLPVTNSWAKLERPQLHHQYGCMVVHEEKVFVLGGDCNDGEKGTQQVSSAGEEYDLELNLWRESEIKLPMGLYLHHAILMEQ